MREAGNPIGFPALNTVLTANRKIYQEKGGRGKNSRAYRAIMSLLILTLSAYGIFMTASMVRTHIDSGAATIARIPETPSTPYLTGPYIRLAYIQDLTLLNLAGRSLGISPQGAQIPPPTPSEMIGDDTGRTMREGGRVAAENAETSPGVEGNRNLDAWVSATRGYITARETLKEHYGIDAPKTPYGEFYRYVDTTTQTFIKGDLIISQQYSGTATGEKSPIRYNVLRNGTLIALYTDKAPPQTTTLPEYPEVPRPTIEKGLYGFSADLLYTIQYLDAMTPGSLTEGHSVALTGTVGQFDGDVLPVGGVEEKVEAASQEGADAVVIPQGNSIEKPSLSTAAGVRVIPAGTVGDVVDSLCRIYASGDAVCETDKSR